MTLSTLAGGKSRQFSTLEIETVFDFYKPGPPLSKFVDNFWIYEGDGRPAIERILPTGAFELAINLRKDELGFYDAENPADRSRLSGSVVSGAHARCFAPEPADEIFIIGVHFKPGGAFHFLGHTADEFADTHVDLDTLWGSSAGLLRERLSDARTSIERFHLLEHALHGRLRQRAEQHYAVSAAVEMFAKAQVGTTVRDAAKYLGLSQRRFIQVFKWEVGLTPKLFSRIQRFQQTRILIEQDSSPDWVSLALDRGYFDQSHLIREFSEFSGFNPTDYLNRHRSFIEFSEQLSDSRSILSNTSLRRDEIIGARKDYER